MSHQRKEGALAQTVPRRGARAVLIFVVLMAISISAIYFVSEENLVESVLKILPDKALWVSCLAKTAMIQISPT